MFFRRAILGIIALSAIPLWAAGTCAVSAPQQIGQGASPSWVVKIACIGDVSSGSFPAVTLSKLQPLMGGYISRVETVPGTTQPTSNYTETLIDAQGGDELGGQGSATMSSSAVQVFAVSVGTPITAQEVLNLSGNSVASANVTVYVYVVTASATLAAVVAIGGGGGGGGGFGGVTSVNGTAGQIAVSPNTGATVVGIANPATAPGPFGAPSLAATGTYPSCLLFGDSTNPTLPSNCTPGSHYTVLGIPSTANSTIQVDGTALTGVTTNQNIRSVTGDFGDFTTTASALSAAAQACTLVQYAGTIQRVVLTAAPSGGVTVDVRTVALASWTGPGSTSTITASDVPALSSATVYTDTTLTGWTTSIAANTMVCFYLSSPTTVTGVQAILKVAAN